MEAHGARRRHDDCRSGKRSQERPRHTRPLHGPNCYRGRQLRQLADGQAFTCPSATTGFRSTPIPSISISTTSPCAHRHRRVARVADARRRARQDQVAGLEREHGRRERDEPADAEDEVGGVAVLEQLAVQALHDPQAAAVAELRHRHEPVADAGRTCRTPCRASTACRRTGGSAPRRRSRSGSRRRSRARRPRRSRRPRAADLDRELGLGVDVRRLGRQHDRLARARSRAFSNLPKSSGSAGGSRPGLGDVRRRSSGRCR